MKQFICGILIWIVLIGMAVSLLQTCDKHAKVQIQAAEDAAYERDLEWLAGPRKYPRP